MDGQSSSFATVDKSEPTTEKHKEATVVLKEGGKHGSVLDESEDSNIRTLISGETIYTSANRFEDLNLSSELMKGLHVGMKFQKPREIQRKILPMIVMPPYKDLVAQVSGSGKTSGYMLGMLSRIDPSLTEPQALCICPNIELANENMQVLQKMGKFTGITSELAVPGETRGVRRARVSVNVLIGTPATVRKLINFKKLGVSNIKLVVFDEVDKMLDEDGFRDDALRIVKEIKKANPNLQVLLFSETLNETVKDFAGKTLKDPNKMFLVERKDLALDSVKQYKVNQDNIDLFKGLPDAIICHILSFLPTKIAASTSVLSRRWRYLLASVPNLDIDDSIYLHPEKRDLPPESTGTGRRVAYVNKKWSMWSTSFVNFVERVLALHYDFTVDKFSLKITDCHDPVDPDRVIDWIRKVLTFGVSDLHLVTDWGWGLDFLLPWKIFMSETLVRLRIKSVGKPSTIDVKDFHLPKLRTLYLESVMFRKEDIGLSKLLAGCKVLEELGLEGIGAYMWESCSVSVTTLKRLTFRSEQQQAFHSPRSVSFDTPNLVYLEYTQVNAHKYPKVNFDSLVEAKIDLQMTCEQEKWAELEALGNEENDLFGDSTNFIKGICNVQSLYISGSTLEVLTFCCKAIPIFRNLTHLTIKSARTFGWRSLPRLLKSCPNLETLVFKGLLHRCRDVCLCKSPKEDDFTCLSTSPVKVVKILIDDDKIEKHLEQVKQFLETMPNLERLVLYYDSSFDQDLVQVSTQLQRVASPKCRVQLMPSNPTLSSTKWGPLL